VDAVGGGGGAVGGRGGGVGAIRGAPDDAPSQPERSLFRPSSKHIYFSKLNLLQTIFSYVSQIFCEQLFL
jgi:hypothetical protein